MDEITFIKQLKILNNLIKADCIDLNEGLKVEVQELSEKMDQVIKKGEILCQNTKTI